MTIVPTVQCKTTPGVGDFMFALNKVLMLSWRTGHIFDVEFHWKHGPDHLHHFEDPETIIERFNYTLPFYRHHDRLKITHHFDSWGHPNLERKRFVPNDIMRSLEGINSMAKVEKLSAEWVFSHNHIATDTNKVVIWRSLFNAEIPRLWKRLVTTEMWEEIIDILTVHGYEVVELTYRTPIREVFYHIASCNFVVCYDGMWHYVAKNFRKPMIVTSRSGITRMHTPNALMLDETEGERNIIGQLKKLHIPCKEYEGKTTYEFICAKNEKYIKRFDKFYALSKKQHDQKRAP